MRLIATTMILIAALQPSLANVELDDSINDVYYRGTAELIGSHTHNLEQNEYVGASKESPIFIRIRFAADTTLSDTKVDLTSDDDNLNQPINLALMLDRFSEGYSLAADVDAVQIVRWVQGEQSIWLRVQQDSSTWVQGPEGLQAPSQEARVSYTIGLDQYSTPMYASHLTNLPGNMREGAYRIQETLLCMDFSQSQLTGDGTQQSILSYFINAFEADAETSPGVYEPGTAADIVFTGNFSLARGKDQVLNLTPKDDAPIIDGILNEVDPSFWQQTHARLSFNLDAEDGGNLLSGNMLYGTKIVMEVPEGVQMGIQDAWFVGSGVERGGLTAGTPVGDGLAFDKMTITWFGEKVALNDKEITIDLILELPANTPAQDLQLNWHLELAHRVFDRVCGPGIRVFPQQTQTVARLRTGAMLPHVTDFSGNFKSEVLLSNPADTTQTIGLHGYDAAGNWLGVKVAELAAHAAETMTFGDDLDENIAYLRLSTGTAIEASIAYQANGENKGPAQLPQTTTSAKSWRVYAGNGDLTYDGLAVVNVGNAETTVQVTQYDGAGNLVTSKTAFTLAVGAKSLYVLSSEFEAVAGSYYVVSADQPLAPVAVRGDWQSEFLWQNQATVID